MHVGPHRQVLRLLKGPLGQRHLADGLLPHLRGLGEPLGLALGVKKAVALSSLLKGQAAAGQSPCARGQRPSRRLRWRQDSSQRGNAAPVTAPAAGQGLIRQRLGFDNVSEIPDTKPLTTVSTGGL